MIDHTPLALEAAAFAGAIPATSMPNIPGSSLSITADTATNSWAQVARGTVLSPPENAIFHGSVRDVAVNNWHLSPERVDDA